MISTLGLRRFKTIPAAVMVAGLAACVPSAKTALAPSQPPSPVQPPQPAPIRVESPESKAARGYFAQMQQRLLGQGLLRVDGGGEDTPFTDHMLAENFVRLALYDEYQRRDGKLTQVNQKHRTNRSILRRWQAPVHIEVHFGPSMPEAQKASDMADLQDYAARLSKVTGHPISIVPKGGNFLLHVVSEDERMALGPVLAQQMPTLGASDLQDITQMPRSTYCMVYALSAGNSGVYERAIAVVRAEHPDLLRQSCYHEEIAQGLGLANDSPYARPSIFNDDEEFALLTTMDEMMLKMLYDQSLKPGMVETEARPHIKRLASELKG